MTLPTFENILRQHMPTLLAAMTTTGAVVPVVMGAFVILQQILPLSLHQGVSLRRIQSSPSDAASHDALGASNQTVVVPLFARTFLPATTA